MLEHSRDSGSIVLSEDVTAQIQSNVTKLIIVFHSAKPKAHSQINRSVSQRKKWDILQ